jgi:hypothetical protein
VLTVLAAAVAVPAQRAAAIFALGFSGFAGAVDACLPFLDDPDDKIARLAAEAIAGITDLRIDDDAFLRAAKEAPPAEEDVDPSTAPTDLPPLEEDLATDLSPDPADQLPLLDGARVRSWWEQRQKAYDATRRYVRGAPAAAPAFEAALGGGALRRSGPLAFEVAVRSGGRVQLPALRLNYPSPVVPGDVVFTREPSWR